jgi:putative restriction endonuclease
MEAIALTAFWLTYKPLNRAAPRGWPPEEMDALVRNFEGDPASATPLWRIASSKAASIGDRVYLFKQGSGQKGIFGVGELIEAPREQVDPTDIDAGSTDRARIRLTHLVNPARAFLLDYHAIADFVPKSLVEAQQSGNGVPEEVARELDNRLAIVIEVVSPLGSADADDPSFDPDSISDERERAVRAIRIRRGQAAFRAALMTAYGQRCAITGCAVEAVLEAAHIHPYLGRLTNHVSNGLLLRADVHTLFDCWLIAVEPTSRTIVVADVLNGSSYAKLAGRKLRATQDALCGASKGSLERRYAAFKARHLR